MKLIDIITVVCSDGTRGVLVQILILISTTKYGWFDENGK